GPPGAAPDRSVDGRSARRRLAAHPPVPPGDLVRPHVERPIATLDAVAQAPPLEAGDEHAVALRILIGIEEAVDAVAARLDERDTERMRRGDWRSGLDVARRRRG